MSFNNIKILLLILLVIIIFFDISFVCNYEKIYNNVLTLNIKAEIISLPEEKSNYNKYILKIIDNKTIKNANGTNIIAYIEKDIFLSPGDIIYLEGEFSKAEGRRNYGGFSYNNYLKQKKIYGILFAESVKKVNKRYDLYLILGLIKKSINDKIDFLYNNEESDFLKSILIGEKEYLSDEIKNNFRNSSLSHILAISGMHVSYIVIALKLLFQKIIKNKKMQNRILIIFLIFFSLLTGLQPSCIRACIMNSLVLISENMYSKNNIYISIIISFCILILINPFNIFSVGMWLSFMGTLGIVLFSSFFSKIIKHIIKNKKIRFKSIILYLLELCIICFSAQIMIFPIMIYNFNTYSLTFFISNILSSIIIGPILILGYLSIIISYFFIPISKAFSIIENQIIRILLIITKICARIPFSNNLTITPSLIVILLYYFCIVILIIFYRYKKISIIKFLFSIFIKKEYYIFIFIMKKMYKCALIIFVFVILTNHIHYNSDFKINFVDVGQGDCTVIQTPKGKNIIIDGGEGGEKSKYDYGKNVVIPYLLDRKIKKLDYVIISHFDSDHVGGLLTVIDSLKVDTIIISRQGEISDNYQIFKEIVKKKNIKVYIANIGDRLQIEDNLYIDFLWPDNNNLSQENILNNNSIVCKIRYNKFSCIFTGDIEEIAENEILEKYKNNLEVMKSDVLKVGHHGSKTSSTQRFIDAIHPKVALIGVGNNNKFGHPNDEVIERLECLRCKYF